MKILHITNAFPYEGHPEYGCFIKEQIDSLGPKVDSKVLFINAHKKGTLEYIKVLRKIREASKGVDIIHCHHLFSFIAYSLSFARGKPVVLSFLNDWTKEVKLNIPEWLKHAVCKFFVVKPQHVIFKSFIPRFLNGEQYKFLPNGVDSDFFNIIPAKDAKQKLGLDTKSHYILFVSSKNLYRKQKRYDIFEKTIGALQIKYPSYNYKPLTMSVDDRETALLKFNSASLHLLCSDYEGSPNSVKEALSCGVPVVARPAGSVEDIMKHIPNSKICCSANPDDLAELTHEILTHPLNRTNIRDALINKKISKNEVALRLMKIYQSSLLSYGHSDLPPIH